MAFNRHERVLSAQKQSVPLITRGKPSASLGSHGNLAFAELDGIGVVQYVKIENTWKQVVQPPSTTQAETVSKNVDVDLGDTTAFIKRDGSRDFTGDQSHGGQSISEVKDLTVGGITNLRETKIDIPFEGDLRITGDGDVKGDLTSYIHRNGYTFTTYYGGINLYALDGSAGSTLHVFSAGTSSFQYGDNVEITMRQSHDLMDNTSWGDEVRSYTIGLGNAHLGETARFNVTSSASGQSNIGIGLQTITDNSPDTLNTILIESLGSNFPAATEVKPGYDPIQLYWGVNIQSDYGINIESLQSGNTLDTSAIQIKATSRINIGASSSAFYSLSQSLFSPNRTKVHGLFEFTQLYKTLRNRKIYTDIGYNTSIAEWYEEFEIDEDGDPPGDFESEYWHEYPKWDAIDTDRIMRAHTHRAYAGSNAQSDEEAAFDEVPYNGTLLIIPNRSPAPTQVSAGTQDDEGNHMLTPIYANRNTGTDFSLAGTVWLVTVFFYSDSDSSKRGLNVGYVVNVNSTTILTPEDMGYATQYYTDGGSDIGKILWNTGENLDTTGIYWKNDMNDGDMRVHASALRMQSGSNYSNKFMEH